jgi:hypothetical protein
LFALLLFALVGVLALAIDAGYLMAERRQAQAKADGAAMAADKAYQRNQTGNIVSTGLAYATSGEDSIDPDEVTITPLASYTVNGIGYVKCVRAVVEHEVTPFFVGAIYSGDWAVRAEAVACTQDEPRQYALIALEEDGRGMIGSGTGSIVINHGGAISNADATFTGTVDWLQVDGPLDAVDGIDINGSANVQADLMNPASAAVTDPLASVPEPTSGQCNTTVYNSAVTIGPHSPDVTVLQPGNYQRGISVSGGGTKSIVLTSGIYCFGRDFDVSSGSGNPKYVFGEGVLLYFYGGAELSIRGGATSFNVSYTSLPSSVIAGAPSGVAAELTGGGCTIAACDAGVAIFYARSNCDDLRLEGGNGWHITGRVYAPCSEIHLAGHSGSEINGQVIGGEVDFTGTSDLTINYVSDEDTDVPLVYLVE